MAKIHWEKKHQQDFWGCSLCESSEMHPSERWQHQDKTETQHHCDMHARTPGWRETPVKR